MRALLKKLVSVFDSVITVTDSGDLLSVEGINFQENDLTELEKTVEPSWLKVAEPLERITDRLSVVWGAVNHLKAVKDTPELRSAIEEIQVFVYCLFIWLIS